MMDTLLVGDLGATKILLEAGRMENGRWRPACNRRYAAAEHPDFDSVLQAFLHDCRTEGQLRDAPARACLGVAGPAFNDRARMTNLGWVVDGGAIGARFGIAGVRVVNDFAAAASGIEMLRDEDLAVLQAGEPLRTAPRVVIGAGSGLGVAYLLCTGSGYQVLAGEGGHAGFAPAADEQLELWRDLHARLGRVAVEHVVSGPGLVRIHDFVVRTSGGGNSPTAASSGITPAAITQAALDGRDPLCLRALDLFIACYGAVAGDHALTALARGGVYVAGGIAPKILPRLAAGGFLAAFNAKGVHADAARKMPVAVVVNERLGLLGCARLAADGVDPAQPAQHPA